MEHIKQEKTHSAKAVQTDRTRADELASSRGFVEVRGQDSGYH